MIIFNNWQISSTGVLAQQYDNLTRKVEVVGELPEGYEWSLLVECGENKDTLHLERTSAGAEVVLTQDNLSVSGYYKLQLRGNPVEDTSKTRHTNPVQTYVPASLTGTGEWPEMPTEFRQIEQRILDMNAHPPVPGEDGFWMIWNPDAGIYEKSGFETTAEAAALRAENAEKKAAAYAESAATASEAAETAKESAESAKREAAAGANRAESAAASASGSASDAAASANNLASAEQSAKASANAAKASADLAEQAAKRAEAAAESTVEDTISWDNINGRPFGDFDGKETVLELTTARIEAGSSRTNFIPCYYLLVPGDDYIVVCNDVEFQATCNANGALLLSDPFGTGANETMFVQNAPNGCKLSVYTGSAVESDIEFTLSVTHHDSPYVRPIDPKYLVNSFGPVVTTSGTSTAYTATIPGIVSLSNGMRITIIPHVDSAANNATLNLNGLGAKRIYRYTSSSDNTAVGFLYTDFLKLGRPTHLTYDGLNWVATSMTKPDANDLFGVVDIKNGGTGANNARDAKKALGVVDPVQPSWIQKDDTQLDYIKDKPFGVTAGDVVAGEKTLPLLGEFNFAMDAHEYPIELGKTYVVTFNGVEYPCEAVEYTMNVSGFGSFSGIGFGNTTGKTGEPFMGLYGDFAGAFGTAGIVYQYFNGVTSATIEIHEALSVQKIPMAYLPDGIGNDVSWNDLKDNPFAGFIEVMPETTVAFAIDGMMGMLSDTYDVELGKEYTVTWNGVEYKCTGISYEEEGVACGVVLGNLGAMTGVNPTTEPFAVVFIYPELVEALGAPGMVIALDGSAFATLSISAVGGFAVPEVDHLVLLSPNGTKFAITVDDAGNLTTTKLS